MKVNTHSTLYKSLRAMAFVAVSAALGSIVAYITNHPAVFGVATVAINGFLVYLKNDVIDPLAAGTTETPVVTPAPTNAQETKVQQPASKL